MELMMQNGDYVSDGRGGVKRSEGGEEILQRVLFQLSARRGAFPLLPQVGSELWRLPRAKEQHWPESGIWRSMSAYWRSGRERPGSPCA